MTKSGVLEAIGRTHTEVEQAMETVRLYLKQELADCKFANESGIKVDRSYENKTRQALSHIEDFRWDEDI